MPFRSRPFRYRVDLVTAGPAGPVGAIGPAGPAGNSYRHEQTALAATWLVDHGLGCFPAVTVLIGNQIVHTDVFYINPNQVSIVFATPYVGSAVCS